jgi:asparagine synthase (glutamine-hydrolysing)
MAAAHLAADGLDHLSKAQQLETETLLPGYILSSQGDRMLMAHGVEGRFPFLDHEVVEYVSRMPPRMKMRVLNEKYILKLACGDLVPEEILKRPKQPYRAPDSSSFFCGGTVRRQWVADTLSRDRVARDGVFDPDRVEKLVNKAISGRVIGNQDNMALVGILSTQILIDQFVRHRGASPEPSGDHGSH